MKTNRKPILVVINGDAEEPIVYSEPVNTIRRSVSRAVKNLALGIKRDDMRGIIFDLQLGESHWWNETYCFCVI